MQEAEADLIKYLPIIRKSYKIKAIIQYLEAKCILCELIKRKWKLHLVRNELIKVIIKLIKIKTILTREKYLNFCEHPENVYFKNCELFPYVNSFFPVYSISELYCELCDLSIMDNNLKKIIKCYNMISDIIKYECRDIAKNRLNTTFTQAQLIKLVQRLIDAGFYHYGALYAFKIHKMFYKVKSFSLVFKMSTIITICYLNCGEIYKAANVLNKVYRCIEGRHKKIIFSLQIQILVSMILVMSLHDILEASRQLQWHLNWINNKISDTNNSVLVGALEEFMRFLNANKFRKAIEMIYNVFSMVNSRLKASIVKILENRLHAKKIKTHETSLYSVISMENLVADNKEKESELGLELESELKLELDQDNDLNKELEETKEIELDSEDDIDLEEKIKSKMSKKKRDKTIMSIEDSDFFSETKLQTIQFEI